MFENLTEKFDRAFKILKGEGNITEINVAETLKEVRRALLDADVNFKTAKEFTENVKQKALGQQVLTAVKPGELLIKITHDELKELMGGTASDINYQGNPGVILMSGLQGSGKTTFSGKLANYLSTKKGKKPLLVACDIYRPAAIDQLHVVGESIGVEVYSERENKNAVSIATNALNYAKQNGFNVMIVDTAGRLAIDEQMMKEIYDVKQAIQPSEILFVVDSMTGQDAVNTARAFNERLDFDGVVLTKLDGDTRGGAALSIKSEVNKPIKFVGTGEKMDALDVFYAKRLEKRIKKDQFDFNDFVDQIGQIRKMGSMKDLLGMIPGVGKAMKDVEINEDAFKHIEAIIHSMTPTERSNPSIINPSRKARIAKGSGRSLDEVNRLMKQFEQTKQMMKMMTNKTQMAQMMQQMKGMKGGMPR